MSKKQILLFLIIAAGLCCVLNYTFAHFQKEEARLLEKASQNKEEKKEEKPKKILVLYYSHTGKTEEIANKIWKLVGGDKVKLETEKVYKEDDLELQEEALYEQKVSARPKLKTKVDIEKYDIIFIGHPIWHEDMPMPLYTLYEEYDFSKKTIIPFATAKQSEWGSIPGAIKKLESNAKVLEGMLINEKVENPDLEIKKWITKLDLNS